MIKKILYVLVAIIIIVMFTIIWKDSNKEVIPTPPANPVTQEENTPIAPVDTTSTISNDLNNIDINSGIDTDLNSIDGDIKTL